MCFNASSLKQVLIYMTNWFQRWHKAAIVWSSNNNSAWEYLWFDRKEKSFCWYKTKWKLAWVEIVAWQPLFRSSQSQFEVYARDNVDIARTIKFSNLHKSVTDFRSLAHKNSWFIRMIHVFHNKKIRKKIIIYIIDFHNTYCSVRKFKKNLTELFRLPTR